LRYLEGIEDNHEAQESHPHDRQGSDASGRRVKVHREGANHTIYVLGGTRIPIPRHNEIGERLAMAILVEAEAELGRRWWL
jgi:hypothetical protein